MNDYNPDYLDKPRMLYRWVSIKRLLVVAGLILSAWLIAGLVLYGACQLYLNHIKGWF